MSALILNVSSCDVADLVVVKIGRYRNQKRSSFIHYSFLIEFISQVIDLDWNREVILDVIFEDVVLSVLELKCKMKTIFKSFTSEADSICWWSDSVILSGISVNFSFHVIVRASELWNSFQMYARVWQSKDAINYLTLRKCYYRVYPVCRLLLGW